MARATSDGEEISLTLSLREAAMIQVLLGAACPSEDTDKDMYRQSSDIFWALDDFLLGQETQDYWDRVHDSLGDGFGYVFKETSD